MSSDPKVPSPTPRSQSRINGGRTLYALGFGVAAGVLAFRQISRARRRIDLAGKTVVVTGGSRGLGLILARKLAGVGARVCIIARDLEELERAKENIGRSCGSDACEIYAIVADVADRTQIQESLRAAARQFGAPIEILINNAGLIQVGPMEVMTDHDYDEALRTHFWGPYHAIQEVLPAMRKRGSGRIVNIASIGGKISVPHLLPYSTSKFALVGFSEGLRSELMKENIFVTTVCPGLIRTGSPRNAFFKGKYKDEYNWFTLGDSLPVLSMSADRCASQIIDALRFGDAEIVTSLFGKVGAFAHGLAPSLVIDTLGLISAMLPSAGDSGTDRFRGADSETALTQSALTALTRAAERENNQL